MKRVANPPNRYSPQVLEWLDEPEVARLEIFEEHCASIVTENKSPDISFRYSINPYRGCFHGCSYCYARPTHQYIDFGAGTDFERKIVAKVNAPEKLIETFEKKSWRGERIVFSGITDCYQPLEAQYELTKRCLEVCLKYRNPVSIITKGALVIRDLELLKSLATLTDVRVYMSLAFADDAMAKRVEPGAPRPSTRLRALRELSEAGITTGISLSPVIPGLNDQQIPQILSLARKAGAQSAFMVLLRLPAEVRDVFTERLEAEFPTRAQKVLSQTRAMKNGALNRAAFGERMKGAGEQWRTIEWLFKTALRQNKYPDISEREALDTNAPSTFQRPRSQLELF